jgi:hypothetical protein
LTTGFGRRRMALVGFQEGEDMTKRVLVGMSIVCLVAALGSGCSRERAENTPPPEVTQADKAGAGAAAIGYNGEGVRDKINRVESGNDDRNRKLMDMAAD